MYNIIIFTQKIKLVEGYNVYLKKVDFDIAVNSSKDSVTGLMRSLIGIFYTKQRLAACSSSNGLNKEIKGAVFRK